MKKWISLLHVAVGVRGPLPEARARSRRIQSSVEADEEDEASFALRWIEGEERERERARGPRSLQSSCSIGLAAVDQDRVDQDRR